MLNLYQSLSPGVTIKESSEAKLKSIPGMSFLETDDIANALLYILGTPPNVQVISYGYFRLDH